MFEIEVNRKLGRTESLAGTSVMSFQGGIGSLGGTVYSGGTLHPSLTFLLRFNFPPLSMRITSWILKKKSTYAEKLVLKKS